MRTSLPPICLVHGAHFLCFVPKLTSQRILEAAHHKHNLGHQLFVRRQILGRIGRRRFWISHKLTINYSCELFTLHHLRSRHHHHHHHHSHHHESAASVFFETQNHGAAVAPVFSCHVRGRAGAQLRGNIALWPLAGQIHTLWPFSRRWLWSAAFTFSSSFGLNF